MATVAKCAKCKPSENWLGNYAADELVRKSGLWNHQHVTSKNVVTEEAIERYNGNLYSELSRNIKGQLQSNGFDIVLIVSALMGIISPTDLIPDYELMMNDQIPEFEEIWEEILEIARRKVSIETLGMQVENEIIPVKSDRIMVVSERTGKERPVRKEDVKMDWEILASKGSLQIGVEKRVCRTFQLAFCLIHLAGGMEIGVRELVYW
ncbi:MAG: peroxide stress protein YaaA [Candidatus Methanospirareceae archaeon]